MTDRSQELTNPVAPKFDPSAYPPDSCFHDRREGRDRRAPGEGADGPAAAPAERRAKKERRRRVDPTTFEKQYNADEMEFMTAMQRFKVQTGRPFPTYAEVLRVAHDLGYRKVPRRNLLATATGDEVGAEVGSRRVGPNGWERPS